MAPLAVTCTTSCAGVGGRGDVRRLMRRLSVRCSCQPLQRECGQGDEKLSCAWISLKSMLSTREAGESVVSVGDVERKQVVVSAEGSFDMRCSRNADLAALSLQFQELTNLLTELDKVKREGPVVEKRSQWTSQPNFLMTGSGGYYRDEAMASMSTFGNILDRFPHSPPLPEMRPVVGSADRGWLQSTFPSGHVPMTLETSPLDFPGREPPTPDQSPEVPIPPSDVPPPWQPEFPPGVWPDGPEIPEPSPEKPPSRSPPEFYPDVMPPTLPTEVPFPSSTPENPPRHPPDIYPHL